MKQRAHKGIEGFSLIEVIVGMAVMGLVTIPICASLVLSVRLNSHSRDLMNAQLAAAGMVETLMESGIDTSVGGSFASDGTGGWTMRSSAAPEGVTVTVTQARRAETALPWYHVTVTSQVNSQTVELKTSIRGEGGGT